MAAALTPEVIGKVVQIQIHDRESPSSDNILVNSVRVHVGTLQMYYHDQESILFQLEGVGPVIAKHEDHFIEFQQYTA